MLASLKGSVEVDKFVSFYVKCLIQNSNYEEIVSSVNYMTTGLHSLEGLAKSKSGPVSPELVTGSPITSKQEVLKLGASSAGEVLLCILEHDDWVVFRKLYQQFREDQLVDDASLKRIISVLVEKQQLETLRFVISFTLKDTQSFMKLKLSENQYKFIILSFVKSYIEVSSKLNEGLEEFSKTESASEAKTSQDAKSEDGMVGEIQSASESDDFLEIVDEATLQKILQDIAGHEKQGQK